MLTRVVRRIGAAAARSRARRFPATGELSRFYAFGFVWMAVIVMPVYTPFLVARGLTVGDVLSLQAVCGLTITALEIPTGLLGDAVGRRWTILVGTLLNLAGVIGFATARGFAAYVAIEIVLGAGISLVSGADMALIYEVLDRGNFGRDRRRRVLGNYVTAQALGEAAASLLGGALATLSMRIVGFATIAEAVLPLIIVPALPRTRSRLPARDMRPAAIAAAFRTVFRKRYHALLFTNMVIWNLSTFTAVWLLQPYWLEQGMRLRWFGVTWAATLITVALASRAAHALTRRLGLRIVILVITASPVLAYSGMATLSGAAGVASGFLFYVSRGLSSVVLAEAYNHAVPPGLRATFNSLSSGTVRFLFALCGPIVGFSVDRIGLDRTCLGLAATFLLAFAAAAVPLARQPSDAGRLARH